MSEIYWRLWICKPSFMVVQSNCRQFHILIWNFVIFCEIWKFMSTFQIFFPKVKICCSINNKSWPTLRSLWGPSRVFNYMAIWGLCASRKREAFFVQYKAYVDNFLPSWRMQACRSMIHHPIHALQIPERRLACFDAKWNHI